MAHDALGLTTRAIHAGADATVEAHPLTTPIYETTTFVFESAEAVRDYNESRTRRYLYSRYENPTTVAVETQVAVLEGADAALVFSSGMGATATLLLALLQQGDEVVCSAAIYGGTLRLLADVLAKLGVATRVVDVESLQHPHDLVRPGTRLVWFESPTNPTLRCVDIRALAAACRASGAWSVLDNTFASPVNQQPIALGVDLVMHSATKYLGGHSDITAGAIAGSRALVERVAATRRLVGTVLDPQPAYALGRSLKTLSLRVERQNATALALARRLEADPRVTRVLYPGLPSHPDHEIAARQMQGFGGMVTIDLGGAYERAARFFDALVLVKRAASLGGAETLCSLPVLTSQWGWSPEQLARAGITPGMARLSIGLEDGEDLARDLDQALAASV